MSIKSVAEFTHLKANVLNDYYKNHLEWISLSWNQKKHSEEFTLYACNLGEHLAIDESSLSNGELYTIVTNKDGHGRGYAGCNGKGVKSDFIIKKLQRLPVGKRAMVKSVTMDMSNSMYKIVRKCFPNAGSRS